MYGGYWVHWIIWSSIVGTSMAKKENNYFSEKLEFSTLAMITNGVITELMKRSLVEYAQMVVVVNHFFWTYIS